MSKYSGLLQEVIFTIILIVRLVVSDGTAQPDPAFNLDLNSNKKLILILASFRSGSTFLGTVFDKNPNVHYLYEPFHDNQLRKHYKEGGIKGARADHTESDLRMLYLQQILHSCTVFKTVFKESFSWCGTPEENLSRFNTTDCLINRSLANISKSQHELCLYRDTIVIKAIRIKTVVEILKIAKIETIDVRIIHLIRHPVPLMMSRRFAGKFFAWDDKKAVKFEKKIKSEMTSLLGWESSNYCQDQLKTIKFISQNGWLQKRYLLLTHFEISTNAPGILQRIYNFVGLNLTEDVNNYVNEITQETKKEPNKVDALNVHKNSTEVVDNWMKLEVNAITVRVIRSIEGHCKQLFGYLKHEFMSDSTSRNLFYE